MASFFSIFLLFLAVEHNTAEIENIDLNYTNAKSTFEELYRQGVAAYGQENWDDTVGFMEKAISDYRHEQEVKSQCWLKCQDDMRKEGIFEEGSFDGQLLFLHYSIKIRKCSSLCEEKYLGRRGVVSSETRQKFRRKEGYAYLQYAEFQRGNVMKAAEAATAYHYANPNDTTMEQNVNFYAQELNMNKTLFRDPEELPHLKMYHQAEKSYSKSDFKGCVDQFEEALTLTYKETEKCYALCEQQHEQRQSSMSVALFSHYVAILECRTTCRTHISVRYGKAQPNFLPFAFHYLQYCYYEIGMVEEAASAAYTYGLFYPSDPIMNQNIGFYQKKLPGQKLLPRKRTEAYVRQFLLENNLMAIAKGYADPTGTKDKTTEEEVDKIFNDLKAESDKTPPSRGDDGEFDEEIKTKEYRDQGRWKRDPIFKDTVLFKEEEELNGTDRVAFDNVISPQECRQLMRIAKKVVKSGDGYEHSHKDAERPFTEKEKFKGVTIIGAAQHAQLGDISLEDAELYMNSSDKARRLTQEYFDIPVHLHFAFTHLVCRYALESEMVAGENHLSHPLHSDNCNINMDGPGTCPKRPPAYTWRDYSALLYLNDDFEGGEFIFGNHDNTIQASIRPKCGRMVAFRSDGIKNLHGVLGVRKGVRCAVPLWFTLSPDKREGSRYKADHMLLQLKKNKRTDAKHQRTFKMAQEKMAAEAASGKNEL